MTASTSPDNESNSGIEAGGSGTEVEVSNRDANNPSRPGENPLSGAQGPKRNWPRTWALTLGMLAGGWSLTQLIKKEEPEAPVETPAVESKRIEPAEIVFPGDTLYKRLEAEGDLEKLAYQYVENGLFSYEIPLKISSVSPNQTKTEVAAVSEIPAPTPSANNTEVKDKTTLGLLELANRESFVAVRGLTPGAENSALINSLIERGVIVKDGESFDRLRQEEYNKVLLEQSRSIMREKELYQSIRSAVIWGAVIVGVAFLIKRIRESAKNGLLNPLASKSLGDVLTDRPTEGFDHIGGIAQVVAEMKNLMADISLRQKGDTSVELAKGILLHGPSGTGKTMLARALAAETSCPYVSFKGSELSTQFFVGSGVASVRNAFEKARELRDAHTAELRKKGNPEARGVCIVFIDEFDSLAQRRHQEYGGGADKEETKVVNTLLAEMDNVSKELNRDIIIIAATNSIEVLDPAAIRPGRFSRRIEVPQPDSKEARLDVLEKALKYKYQPRGFKIENSQSLKRLAALTKGNSGADLVGILDKASAMATREQRKVISFEDLMEGLLQEEIGFRSARVVPIEERRKTAWHELAGHALLAHFCGIASRMISMQPRGQSLGFVIPDPEAISEFAPTKAEILRQVLLTVGGTVAEGKKYSESGRTLGNAQDLQQARTFLRQLISTGLLGDSFAQSLMERDPRTENLSKEHRDLLDRGLANAIKTARSIIDTIDPKVIEDMVEAALATDVELIGDEAEQFIESHLSQKIPNDKRKEIEKIIEGFLKDPLEESAPIR